MHRRRFLALGGAAAVTPLVPTVAFADRDTPLALGWLPDGEDARVRPTRRVRRDRALARRDDARMTVLGMLDAPGSSALESLELRVRHPIATDLWTTVWARCDGPAACDAPTIDVALLPDDEGVVTLGVASVIGGHARMDTLRLSAGAGGGHALREGRYVVGFPDARGRRARIAGHTFERLVEDGRHPILMLHVRRGG